MTVVILTTPLNANTPWTVPGDWNNAANTVECIGAGGGGGPSLGGGGGGYSRITNLTLTPLGTATFRIGAGGVGSTTAGTGMTAGGVTWFGVGATSLATSSVGANGGGLGTGASTTGATGSVLAAGGGAGANTGNQSSGGGGAGGPGATGLGASGASSGPCLATGVAGGGSGGGANGGGGVGGSAPATGNNGAAGGASITAGGQTGTAGGTAGTTSVVGGSGSQGSGGGGGGGDGSTASTNGGVGGAGHDLAGGSVGGGGGGGAAGTGVVGNVGGGGGLYGGGGGASGYGNGTTNGTGGAGAQGVIVISYTPVAMTGTNYFVSSTATGAGTGTIASPWNIPQLNAHTFNGADKVFFDAGHSAISGGINLTATNFSTTNPPSSVNPVTFDSYAGTQAAINSGTVAGFSATSAGGIIVRNLQFTGGGVAGAAINGVQFLNTSNSVMDFCQVINCTIIGYGIYGIRVNASNTVFAGYSNLTIQGCTIHDCGGFNDGASPAGGIVVGTNSSISSTSHNNWVIQGCTIYSIPGSSNTGTATGFGMLLYCINNLLIQNCVVHDCGNLATTGGPAGMQYANCNNLTCQFCEVYNMSDGGSNIDGDGWNPSGCTNCITQYCYSHNNAGAGFGIDNGFATVATDMTVRYCISQNDGSHGTSNGSACGIGMAANAAFAVFGRFYNNTVYSNTGAPAAAVLPGSVATTFCGGTFANNILYTTTGQSVFVSGAPSVTMDYNDLFRTGGFSCSFNGTTRTTLATWRTATGYETHGVATNPTLVNPGGGGTTNGYNQYLLTAYLLQSSSTMKGTGVSVQTAYGLPSGPQDFYGMQVPLPNFNVGAADTDILAAGQALL